MYWVNSWCGKAETLDQALAMMSQKMFINRDKVKAYVEDTGMAQAAYGFTTGQVTDLEWIDPELEKQMELARQQVLELYGEGGVLEVDEGAVVSVADYGYQVEVWVWVSNADAGITEEMDDDADMERRYVAAAEHPVAEFDGAATASMGDDPGAYVCGWIQVSLNSEVLLETV